MNIQHDAPWPGLPGGFRTVDPTPEIPVKDIVPIDVHPAGPPQTILEELSHPPIDSKGEWHFYEESTGLFSGASFFGTQAEAQAQLDHKGAGWALHQGPVDYLSQRKCLESGSLLDHRPDPPWDGTDLTLYDWVWNEEIKRWARAPRDKKRRIDQRMLIRASRDAAIDAPLELPFGTFDHHEASRATIARKAQELTQFGGSIEFTLADNSTTTLTAEQMLEVWSASRNREQSMRDRANVLYDQLERAEGQEAIEAIVWTAP